MVFFSILEKSFVNNGLMKHIPLLLLASVVMFALFNGGSYFAILGKLNLIRGAHWIYINGRKV
jgi:hypothetical protein